MRKGLDRAEIAAVKRGLVAVWEQTSGALRWQGEVCAGLKAVQARARQDKVQDFDRVESFLGSALKCRLLDFAGSHNLRGPVGVPHLKHQECTWRNFFGKRWCSGSNWRSAWRQEQEEEEEEDVSEGKSYADGSSRPSALHHEPRRDDVDASSSSRPSRGPQGKYENLMEVVRQCKLEVRASESRENSVGLGGKLLEGPFKFVQIPSRSWSLVDPCDKLLAKAVAMTLNKVFEPGYSDDSYAFRPGKGCHSAMLQMKKNWRGTNFFLKFNIKRCYDQITRQHVRRILLQDIWDHQFLDLVLRLYQTEVRVCRELKHPPPETGFPRGSIVGKALCNVYLNRLDQEISRMQREFEYSRDLEKSDSEQDDSSDSGSESDREYEYHHGDADVRLRYIRYADEFLVGFTGPKPLMMEIQAKIVEYLKTELHLEAELDHLVHATSGHVIFLGMRIAALPESKGMKRYAKWMENRRRIKFRLRQFAKRRQEDWDHQLRKLSLLAWSRAFAKARSSMASRMLTEHALHKKARQVVETAVMEKLGEGEQKETIQRLLEREKVEMMKVGLLGIPDEIAEAHKNLSETIQDFLDEEDRVEADLAAVTPRLTEKVRAERRKEYRKRIPLQILAPMEDITDKLKKRGVLAPKKSRPNSMGPKTVIPDEEIVSYFASVGYGLLTYYRCCDNVANVRRLVDYQVRWSAIFTLASKHKSSSRQVINKYTRDLHVFKDGQLIAKFPSSVELVRSTGKKFLPDMYQEIVNDFIR